jgi:DNA (cytosine-5)-methyltransferase 1
MKLKDILEKEVDEKYTLSDKLWSYLQNYAIKQKAKGNGFGFGMVDLDGISRTLSARYYKDGSEILIPQGKGKNPRKLTPRECARLMGYPDSYIINAVSDVQAYRQCGNSVIVPLISAVTGEIMKTLNIE